MLDYRALLCQMDAHGMTKLQSGSAVERLGKRTRLGCALLDKSCHFPVIIISTGAGDAKVLWFGLAELPWPTATRL